MNINILFAAGAKMFKTYEAPLLRAFQAEGIKAALMTDATPAQVDYIIYAPSSTVQDFTPFTRCKAVLNLWAGVENVVNNPTLTQPLCRMVDPALTQGMVEYVCGHVLRYHLGMDAHILARPGDWNPAEPPLANERRVGVLGLGELGSACAQALNGLGFDVHGWSRGAKTLDQITCHSGEPGLRDCLALCDIVVVLLPLTADTENLLNAETLAMMPQGAVLINPGRGALIDDSALMTVLDTGQIKAATLDVFRVEPLPANHPFWAHPRITVTPHVAASTRPESASRVIARNIARAEAGEPLLHQVERKRGY